MVETDVRVGRRLLHRLTLHAFADEGQRRLRTLGPHRRPSLEQARDALALQQLANEERQGPLRQAKTLADRRLLRLRGRPEAGEVDRIGHAPYSVIRDADLPQLLPDLLRLHGEEVDEPKQAPRQRALWARHDAPDLPVPAGEARLHHHGSLGDLRPQHRS